MAKDKNVQLEDLLAILKAGVAAIQAGQAVGEAIKVVDDTDMDDIGFIIIKRENHTNQVFFSDHEPITGVDMFGHSTHHTDRLIREAHKYDTLDDARDALMHLIDWDAEELNNDNVVSLGVYSIEDDAIVFNIDIANKNNGATLPDKFWKD